MIKSDTIKLVTILKDNAPTPLAQVWGRWGSLHSWNLHYPPTGKYWQYERSHIPANLPVVKPRIEEVYTIVFMFARKLSTSRRMLLNKYMGFFGMTFIHALHKGIQ